MINQTDIIVFDTETTGLQAGINDVIEIAAIAYNARTLEPYPKEQGGQFYSMMRPLRPENIQQEALDVNKKTREQIMSAPDPKIVWPQFIAWVKKYNKKGTPFTAPIAGGKNIRSFDMKFVDDLNLNCSPKKEKTVLFSNRIQLDLEDFLFHWFENSNELENYKMDTCRNYFNLSHDGSHEAMVDTIQTGELIMKFLRLNRALRTKKTAEGKPFIDFRKGK